MTPEHFKNLGVNGTREAQVDVRIKIELHGELGDTLPGTIDPRVVSGMLEKLPKLEGEPITAEELVASLKRLGYKRIEEDAEEPFYRKD